MKKLIILLSSLLIFAACANSEPMPFDQTAAPKAGDTISTIKTDKGDIKIKLFTEKAPETTKNHIELANAGQYDNVPFHRIIRDFMIQTGDFELKNGMGGYSYKGPGTTLEDEIDPELKHIQYAVSMANTGRPNSGGSQFFIVSAADGAHHLDGLHAIFGQVYEGQEIVDALEKVRTNNPIENRPVEEVKIEEIAIETL